MRALFFFLIFSFAFQSEARETSLSVRVKPLEIGAIPRGAQRVRFLSLHFIASCESAVAIHEIRAHHFGLGDTSDFTGVYLLRGVERLTRSASISSDDHVVTLRPKGLMLQACGQMQLDIAADFQRDAAIGSEHQFEVLSEADIVTTAGKLTGKFPLRNLERANVSPLPEGGMSVTFLPLSGSTSAIAERSLAKIQVTSDNVSAHLISSITLTNEGTAKDREIRSLFITTKQDGTALTNTVFGLDGKEVTLRFTPPYLLPAGDSITFHLRGRRYTRRKTVDFILKEPSDLVTESTRQGVRR